MTRFRVFFTKTADAHTEKVAAWWAANRPSAAGLFRAELDAAVNLVARSPGLGTVYEKSPVREVRRILIGRTRYHMYWETNVAARTVWVVAVWHANRGTGPTL